MNLADILLLLPLLLIAGTSVVVMLAIAFKRNHALAAGLTLAGLTAAFISIYVAAPAHIAAPSPPRVSKTSLRLISEEVFLSLLSGPFSAGILFSLDSMCQPTFMARPKPRIPRLLGRICRQGSSLSPQGRGRHLRPAL